MNRPGCSHALIPTWLKIAGWPAAACLLAAAVFTVALANGGPWVAVGLAGFVWLVFVVTASAALLRGCPISGAALRPGPT
jgi:hypothetical protein